MIELDVFDTFQIPYSCLAPSHHDLITAAADTGAGIIIRGGIAHGGPDAEIQRPALNDAWTAAGLDDLLSEEMNRAELILRYTLSHPHCHTTNPTPDIFVIKKNKSCPMSYILLQRNASRSPLLIPY